MTYSLNSLLESLDVILDERISKRHKQSEDISKHAKNNQSKQSKPMPQAQIDEPSVRVPGRNGGVVGKLVQTVHDIERMDSAIKAGWTAYNAFMSQGNRKSSGNVTVVYGSSKKPILACCSDSNATSDIIKRDMNYNFHVHGKENRNYHTNLHSEAAALHALYMQLKKQDARLEDQNFVFYNIRFDGKNGASDGAKKHVIGTAAPCKNCLAMLNHFGVHDIFYTLKEGEEGDVKLYKVDMENPTNRQMLVDESHLTQLEEMLKYECNEEFVYIFPQFEEELV